MPLRMNKAPDWPNQSDKKINTIIPTKLSDFFLGQSES